MSKTTEKKKKARERRLVKERNLRGNEPREKYILWVNFPEKGWKKMGGIRGDAELKAYLEETEKYRERGDRVLEGIVKDLRDKVVARIEATPEQDTKMDVLQSAKKISTMTEGQDLCAAKGL